MSASPKMAGAHKCARCPQTDPAQFSKNRAAKNGLYRLCRTCCKEYQRLYYLGVRRKPTVKLTLVCDNPICEKEFTRSEKTANMHRKERSAKGKYSGKNYCSRSCAAQVNKPHGAMRKLKIRKWKSADQNYWEQVLHDAGLGVDRALAKNMLTYGLHRFIEGVDLDGSVRIVDGVKDKDY